MRLRLWKKFTVLHDYIFFVQARWDYHRSVPHLWRDFLSRSLPSNTAFFTKNYEICVDVVHDSRAFDALGGKVAFSGLYNAERTLANDEESYRGLWTPDGTLQDHTKRYRNGWFESVLLKTWDSAIREGSHSWGIRCNCRTLSVAGVAPCKSKPFHLRQLWAMFIWRVSQQASEA